MQFNDFAQTRDFTPGQAEAIQHLDGPLLISAGAGSGKTFTLTQRIVWALLPGSGKGEEAFLQSIDEALVITFTEKAAGEIKERIRSALRAEGMLEEALKVDSAWVSTIHGMCSRILREHALEVGLDPAFKVISATQEEELRALAIEAVLARTGGEDGPYQDLFDFFGAQKIMDALDTILKNAHTIPGGLDAVNLGPEKGTIDKAVRELYVQVQNPPDGATDNALATLQSYAEQLASYFEGPEDTEVLADILSTKLPGGKASEEISAAIKRLRCAVLVEPYQESARTLLKLAYEIEEEYSKALRASGQIDMAGLIHKTLDVFEAFPEIASLYTDRFKLVMVDEFQDTSQLQVDMIERIVGKGHGHFCTVGDAQQSIYRFQGADVSVYMRHKQDMAKGGAAVIELEDNFRSNSDILSFVRRVCGQQDYFGEEFLDLQAKKEGKPYHGSAPRVELVLAPHNNRLKENPIYPKDAYKATAEHLAKRFKELSEKGHAYSDMVLLLGRMSKAQDFANAFYAENIPCVVAGGSKYYESKHVKVCLDLLSVLANPHDAGSLLSVLTSEALPVSTDDLLLLSTDFGEDGDIPQRQKLVKEFLYKFDDSKQFSPLLQHARRVLRRAWSKLGKVRPAQLFKETVIESGWLAHLDTGNPADQAQAADILKFIRLVENVQEEAAFDMARVANEMRLRSVAESEKPGALSVENLDAVRILTIHSSKGLEFPIVAVADCFETYSKGGPLVTLSEGGVLHTSLASSGSKDKFSFKAESVEAASDLAEYRGSIIGTNEKKEYEERKRLFYVATTRASAALIVCMCVTRKKEGGYPNLVGEVMQGLLPGETDFPEGEARIDYGGSEPLLFTRLEVKPSGANQAEFDGEEDEEVGQGAPHPDTLALPKLEDQAAQQYFSVSGRADFFSYSSLAHDEKAGSVPAPPTRYEGIVVEADDGSLPVPAAPAADADKATDFGSAVHRACEWLALQANEPSAAEIDTALEHAAAEFGVQDTSRLRTAFERWQLSDARAWANSFDTQQPELPFTAVVGERFLEGEIDLFCTTGKKAAIIDYKTGGSANETVEQLHAKHLLQAQCYAFATLQAGYENVELRFVRVEQPDSSNPVQPQLVYYEFTQGDLPKLRDAIAARILAHQSRI